MRLYLRDDERRPDPPPARTDDRKAVLVGLALWVAALAGSIVVTGADVPPEFLWTSVAGTALGILGLMWTEYDRRRHSR